MCEFGTKCLFLDIETLAHRKAIPPIHQLYWQTVFLFNHYLYFIFFSLDQHICKPFVYTTHSLEHDDRVNIYTLEWNKRMTVAARPRV